MQLLGAPQLRQIESHLGARLDTLLAPDPSDQNPSPCGPSTAGLDGLRQLVSRYVLAGGKRLRPQLCVWAYLRTVGEGDEQSLIADAGTDARLADAFASDLILPVPLLDLASAWELFHAFLLAHDDIIDASDERRGRPSLHRQLASLDGGCLRFGTNLAIVAGDLLFGAAMRLLHDLDAPGDSYRQLLRLFSRVACTTGLGQAVDVCQSHVPLDAAAEATLLTEYGWKTAAYTFEGPMLSGAILAGVGDAAQRAISRFALALGQAYQLHNDLIDLLRPAHEGCDLVQGKRTVTLLRARGAMGDGRRREFDQRLQAVRAANGEAVGLAESVRQELLDFGAARATHDLICDFLAQARVAVDSAGDTVPSPLKRGMVELLDALDVKYFETIEAR